jgi:hypothetical protein
MKFTPLFILLLTFSGSLFSQSARKESPQKPPVLVYSKPAAFDSTQSLEEQFKPANLTEYIGLHLFLPPVLHHDAGPLLFSKPGTAPLKGNTHYTVVDVLQGNARELLKQKNVAPVCGFRYKDLSSDNWNELIVFGVFVLKESDKLDSASTAPIYWVICQSKISPYSESYLNAFVANTYFSKQKQVYLNHEVVYLATKSKWTCYDVRIQPAFTATSNDSGYAVFCLLKNDKGEQMQVLPPSDKLGRTILTEKDYDRLQHANRNMKEQMQQEEAERQARHKADCLRKFGLKQGGLIAQEKIEPGMTSEMCKAAWGAPWDIVKSKGLVEGWHYNWRYELHFEKGVLLRVEHL